MSSFQLKQQLFDGGNVTLNQLDVTLTPEDDGKKLVCRAENSHLGPASAVEDSWMLDVYCKPLLHYLVVNSIAQESCVSAIA